MITVMLCITSSCKESSKDSEAKTKIEKLIVCSCEEREKLQSFINEKVIKASNNMSDEEMEDVIWQLKDTGVDIYCHKQNIYLKKINDEWIVDESKTKLDSCDNIWSYY